MPSVTVLSKKALAGLIKACMAVAMLVGLIGIPYLVVSNVWSFLVDLFHEHPVWFVLLAIPVFCFAV